MSWSYESFEAELEVMEMDSPSEIKTPFLSILEYKLQDIQWRIGKFYDKLCHHLRAVAHGVRPGKLKALEKEAVDAYRLYYNSILPLEEYSDGPATSLRWFAAAINLTQPKNFSLKYLPFERPSRLLLHKKCSVITHGKTEYGSVIIPCKTCVANATNCLRTWFRSSPQNEELQKKLQEFADSQTVSSQWVKDLEALVDAVNRQLKRSNPALEAICFGSCSSGFCTEKSDIDITVFNTPTPISVSRVQGVLDILQEDPNSTGLISSEVQYGIGRLMFNFRGREIPMDLTARKDGDTKVVLNSRLLQAYRRYDHRVGPLVAIVKQWTKEQDLYGTIQHCFNSYTIVLLVIYYLQRGVSPAVLPVLHAEYDNVEEMLLNNNFEALISTNRPKHNNSSQLLELLLGFFDFYNAISFLEHVIDIRSSCLLTRTDQWYEDYEVPVAVICPIDGKPTTRRVDERCVRRFREKLQQAREDLTKGISILGQVDGYS